jgi:membrane protease YdiL (CAAX protease family)
MESADACVIQVAPARAPWGLWATLALTAAVLGFARLLQHAVSTGFDAWLLHLDPERDLDELFGLRFCVISLLRALLCTGLIVWLVRLRRGPPPRVYLALNALAPGAVLRWVALTLALVLLADALWYLNGRPIVTEYFVALYQSACLPALLWLALIVAAPLFEEILFRGFLFAGVCASRLGNAGAVLATSAAWTAIHTQYEAPELALIFVLGLLLGLARLRTGSIYAPLAMHAANNALSALELVVSAG